MFTCTFFDQHDVVVLNDNTNLEYYEIKTCSMSEQGFFQHLVVVNRDTGTEQMFLWDAKKKFLEADGSEYFMEHISPVRKQTFMYCSLGSDPEKPKDVPHAV